MHTDFSFLKAYLADRTPTECSDQLREWLREQCHEHGLLPVKHEVEAHFTFMLIESDTEWLHFSYTGHFLPLDTEKYQTLTQAVSTQFPVIDYRALDGQTYVLRHFQATKVAARYTANQNGFDSRAEADPWQPVFAEWQGLLARGITAEDFHRLLPSPHYPGAPVEKKELDYFDLPEHFITLFGWHPDLNYACVEFPQDGPDGRGDFYEPEAGDYTDQERHLRIYIRHYAHPAPGNDY